MIYIAIADDNTIFREGLRSTIEQLEDFQIVINTDNTDSLFQHIDMLPELPHICIIDISMPNSYRALKDIKEKYAAIKVLILSATSNELSIIRSIKIGANGFMLKGFNNESLHKALMSIHTEGKFYTDTYNIRTKEKVTHESLTFHLSYEELELISQLCTEKNIAAIAEDMSFKLKKLEKLKEGLYKKLKVTNRIELILFAIHVGMLPQSTNYF